MPRGKQITKTIQLEVCTLAQAKEDFYRKYNGKTIRGEKKLLRTILN